MNLPRQTLSGGVGYKNNEIQSYIPANPHKTIELNQ